MTRTDRTLLARLLALGLVLTLIVIALDAAGMLLPLEHALYDRRARDCQFFAPPPTDKLVHLDIDDASLEVIGKWPWPRHVYAELVDEIHAAGAKAIAFDVIFPEAEEASDAAPTTAPSTRPTGPDAEFAAALRRFGSTLIPVSFSPRDQDTAAAPNQAAAVKELIANLELSLPDLNAKLRASSLLDISEDDYLNALREAMVVKITQVMRDSVQSSDALRKILLPNLDPSITSSVQLRVMEREYYRQSAMRSVARHGRPATRGMGPLLDVDSRIPPIPVLSDAAAATGFVDEIQIEDGVIRSAPLWMRRDDKVYPSLGLALALEYLGVDPAAVQISSDATRIPLPGGGERIIPVWTYSSPAHGRIGTFIDIPWFGASGKDSWRTMYDYPAHRAGARHMPMTEVWAVVADRQRIERDNRNADDAIAYWDFRLTGDTKKSDAYLAHRPPLTDTQARLPMIDDVLKQATDMLGDVTGIKIEELPPDDQRSILSVNALKEVRTQGELFEMQLTYERAKLRAALSDKAVLIGSTATSAPDFQPTPLCPQCPGVVVHGALFNAVLTGFVFHRSPPWITWLITLLVGLLATFAVANLSPWKALLAAIGLVICYFAINGLFLYDYAHWIVGAAGPFTAVALVWSVLTLIRYISEKAERARITRRFSSYVDPALVNYVIENPASIRLEGQVKDLTVVFTDLAGFTTITEKLQERTVEVLNEYLHLMTLVIREYRGYVNKFLGDGIMFFYGAPRENPLHAIDAVNTVLAMQKALVPFNERLKQQDLPAVTMRAGVATGNMVVGDAGGDQACDYTVLGDNVNLSARLESANKQFGSRTLISGETAGRLEGKFLLRPIGRIQVKGKTQSVMTFEPLAPMADATDKDREFAALTTAAFDAYTAADFAACLAALDRLESACGHSKLIDNYRERCQVYLATPPEFFDGSIVLSEK